MTAPAPQPEPPAEQDIRFPASDGFDLAGTLLTCSASRLGVVISPATGYPRRFYLPFARWLAARGAGVLLYDYRGIGGSAVPDLARSGIDIPDWGRLDLPAAADLMAAHAPGVPLTHVAHSVGGHLPGFAANQGVFARHAFLSVGTGYWGHHHPRLWPLEMYFWWGLGTWSLLRHGALHTGGGWAGEPLPPRAFRSWRRWSHRPGYFGAELNGFLAPQHFAALRASIANWSFSDDPIATPRAAQALMAHYPRAQTHMITRRPADFGLRRIGHDGAFRPGREAIWSEVAAWLEKGNLPD